MKHTIQQILFVAGAILLPIQAAVPTTPSAEERIAKSIRKELLTMPFLTIFDNLSYRVDGDTIHIYGQVIRPTLKSDAAKRVAQALGFRTLRFHRPRQRRRHHHH